MFSALFSLSVLLLLVKVSISTLCPAVNECISSLQSGQSCPKVLPVPPQSFQVPLRFGTFSLTPVRPGVFVYFDGSYNSLILRAGSHLAMLDVVNTTFSFKPDGSRTRTTDAAELVLNGTIPTKIDIVYSHAHFDHVGGATRFFNYMKSKYPDVIIHIWGTEETRRLTSVSTTDLAPVPTVIVGRKGRTLYMSNTLKVSMNIVGGHTQEDLMLHIPPSVDGIGVIMFVDVVFPRWAPPFNFAITQDFRKYVDAHHAILEQNFGLYVGGHIRTGNRRDVEVSLLYANDVMQAARDALRSVTFSKLLQEGFGDSFNPDSPAFGNAWFGFVTGRRVEVDACYRNLLRRWGCEIGGVDLMARGHCFTALMFLAVDF